MDYNIFRIFEIKCKKKKLNNLLLTLPKAPYPSVLPKI